MSGNNNSRLLEVRADEKLVDPMTQTVEIPVENLDLKLTERTAVSVNIPRAKRYRIIFYRPVTKRKSYIDGKPLPAVVPAKVEFSY
jgi:hypothetical protein